MACQSLLNWRCGGEVDGDILTRFRIRKVVQTDPCCFFCFTFQGPRSSGLILRKVALASIFGRESFRICWEICVVYLSDVS
jgi:hypothetical protein